jgi:NAD(P)-dependent dehydrogenase (short-subunit alcohol dehydrogenase family)
MKLPSATALVAGGASGLGEATARALVAAGANAIIFDLNAERGQALAQELGTATRFVAGSVTDEAAVQAAIDRARNEFGSLRLAVNCAGVAPPGRILSRFGPLPLDQFARVIEINLIGTFNILRLAAAAMQGNEPTEQGERGVIINTASIAAYEGQVGQVAYAASKGGVVSLTLAAARDLAQWGIRVVTIAPGLFDTPLLVGLSETARQSLAQQIPFPSRLGATSEFAALVQHIVANPMLNGEVIRLDGALRMGPR